MDLAQTIEPKSDQLNADDLVTGSLTVTVRNVKRGPSKEQPVEIEVDGHRPFRPCKSMRRVLIACWGENGKDWIGRSITLYADPSVKFGGVAVGGIRISHLSHINEQKSMMLTVTRSRRSEYTVQPLTETPTHYPDEAFIENLEAWVEMIKAEKVTVPQLIAKVSTKGQLTSEQIAEIERQVQ